MILVDFSGEGIRDGGGLPGCTVGSGGDNDVAGPERPVCGFHFPDTRTVSGKYAGADAGAGRVKGKSKAHRIRLQVIRQFQPARRGPLASGRREAGQSIIALGAEELQPFPPLPPLVPHPGVGVDQGKIVARLLEVIGGGEARLMRGWRCGCVRELDGSRGERAAPTSASTPPPAASPAWLTSQAGLRRGGAAGVEAEVAEVAAAVQPG